MVGFARAGRRLGLVVASGVAAVLVAAPLAPAGAAGSGAAGSGVARPVSPSYRVFDLGTLPGASDSAALGVNDRGVVVGNSGGQAVLWRNGRIVELGAPGPGSSAVDINERGEVVGNGSVDGASRAFMWRHGRISVLPPLPGDQNSFANAVNDRGDVVGFSRDPGFRAVLWRSDGTMVDLTAETGLVVVNDLDNSGRLAGATAPDGMNQIPVVWSRGHVTVLTSTSGTASAINDRGEVAGYFFVGQAGSFTWRRGQLTEIPLLPDMPPATAMQAQAINNRGQVVGFGGFDGFLWDRGTLSVLPHLYGNGPAAFDINNRGQIVGQVGTTPQNLQPHAVLLEPAR
jgi:uncharacterized membrane protein